VIGHVKFFNVVKRYGFIVPDGKQAKDKSENVFFHETNFEGGIRGTIEDGTEVEYELIPHLRDKKALFVKATGRRYAAVHQLKKGAAYGTD
jgi:cold shock CspA family protein